MAEQLGFDLPGMTALGRDDFLVAPSNALAVSLIDGWQGWPARKMVLTGPEGAGKTHLTHVWAAQAGARILPATDLPEADIPALAQNHIAIEDAPDIVDNTAAQTALFHLHNLLRDHGHSLLVTGTGALPHWPLTLPDLKSRLQAAVSAELDPPDDQLLAAVLVKQFADRQLAPKPDLIPYLIKRMDRSFAAARDLVARLDAESLAQGKPITLRLAAAILDSFPTSD